MITYNLVSRIPEIVESIPDEMAEVLEEGANAIAEDAKQRVPVDTGALRDAIHVEQVDDLTFSVVAGSTEAYYGHMVEFGSAEGGKGRGPIPPHPFLIPAAEVQHARIEGAAMDALGEV